MTVTGMRPAADARRGQLAVSSVSSTLLENMQKLEVMFVLSNFRPMQEAVIIVRLV